jgi:CheY-like chemotaxis protein
LIQLLGLIGFSVKGANEGAAAIRCWQEWSPRLILMDVHMPLMDGLQATRIIKSDPRGKETIVVALTASALDDDRRAVAESGADDFLTKPCIEDELLEMLRIHLKLTYDYEPTGEVLVSAGAAELSPKRLAHLPLALVEELRKAVLSGKKGLIDTLVDQVRQAGDAGIADQLKQLADKYEYDVLAELLEAACAR